MSVWDTLPPDDSQGDVWGNLPPETAEDKRKRLSQPDPSLELSPWEKIAQWISPAVESRPAELITRGVTGSASRFNKSLGDLVNLPNRLAGMVSPFPSTNLIGDSLGKLADEGQNQVAAAGPAPKGMAEQALETAAGLPIDLSRFTMIGSAGGPAGIAGDIARFGGEAVAENLGAGATPWEALRAAVPTAAGAAAFGGIGRITSKIANPLLRRAAGAIGTGLVTEGLGVAGGQSPQEALPDAMVWAGYGGLHAPQFNPKEIPLSEKTRATLTPKEAAFVEGKVLDSEPTPGKTGAESSVPAEIPKGVAYPADVPELVKIVGFPPEEYATLPPDKRYALNRAIAGATVDAQGQVPTLDAVRAAMPLYERLNARGAAPESAKPTEPPKENVPEEPKTTPGRPVSADEMNAADMDALNALTHPNPEVRNAVRDALVSQGKDPDAIIGEIKARMAARNLPIANKFIQDAVEAPGSPTGETAPTAEQVPVAEKAQVSPAGPPTTSPANEVAQPEIPKTTVEVTSEGRGGSIIRIRPASEGAVRLLRSDDGMSAVINTDLGRVRVRDVELPSSLRGTGMGTELYLTALKEAQKRGYAFESLDGRSPSANLMYARLERAGVPIEQDPSGSLIIPADKLTGLNIDAVREQLSSRATIRAKAVPPTQEVAQFKLGDPVQYVASKTGKLFDAVYSGKDANGQDMVRLKDGTLITPKEIRPSEGRKLSIPLPTVDEGHIKDILKSAVARGEEIPADVLKDYPDIAPEAASQAMGASHPAATILQSVFGEKVNPDTPGVKSADPVVEQRWRDAAGYRKPSVWTRTKAGLESAKNSFTRHFIHLDTKHDPVHAQAADILRVQEAVPELAAQKAYDTILGVTKGIGKNQADLMTRILALRDMQKDIERGLYKDKELPFGYKNPEAVASDLSQFEAAVAKPENAPVQRALAARERATADVVGQLVKLKELPETALEDPRYYHRQVIDYMDQKAALGNSTGGVTTGKKGFQKTRSGGGDFNTRYHEAEFEWLSGANSIIETAKNREKLRQTVDILPRLQAEAKAKSAEGDPVTWQSLVPDGYTVWQPKPGNRLFPALTITEKALDRFMSQQHGDVLGELYGAKEPQPIKIKENGMPEGVRESLVMGGPREQWVVPDGVAKTLDTMKSPVGGPVEKFAGGMQTSWKQYVLFNPLRATRYLLNNTSGDLDAAIAADPHITKYSIRNSRELWSYLIKHDASPEVQARMQDLMARRVIGSGLTIHEIPDISKEGALSGLLSENGNVVQRAITKYWNGVKNFNSFRESVLRASAYDRAIELMSNGKKVYWASNPAEVDALPNMQDRAAKVATELLGDYGNVSHAGEYIRRHLAPFWSWQEINAPRYVRLFKNAATSPEGGSGRVAGVMAKKGAMNLASFAFKATVLSGMIAAWNKLRFPDDQAAIAALGRGKPVLVLGKTSDGQLHYVRFEGALADALDWAGAGNVIQDVADVASGKSTIGDKAAEAVKAPVNRLVQAWEPFSKTTFELATGRSVYPNIFEEGKSFKLKSNPIRDRGEHLARVVSLDKLWNWAHDKPTSGPKTSAAWKISDALATYSANPDESAYFESKRLANDFVKNTLKREPFGGGDITDRQNALYYFKKAARWGDEEKAKKWLREWVRLSPPGTKVRDLDRALQQSLQAGNPLGSIPTKYHQAFIDSLDPKQKEMVTRAVRWYYGSKKK